MTEGAEASGPGLIECCVCHRRFPAADTARLGNRDFCRVHHLRALEASKAHFTRSGIVELILLGVFVAGTYFTLGTGPNAMLPTSLGTGLLLALVPAAVWMYYIYRQDRLEPEPWPYVLGVFLLAGLLAHAVALPIAQDVFAIETWRHRSPMAELVASTAIVAPLQMLAVYAAVRCTVWLTPEFDEPVDGVVYASAAALGVATAENVAFVVGSEGILPVAGAVKVVSTTILHVAAAGLLGWGLGRARFSGAAGRRALALGFAASVLVLGTVREAVARAGTQGATFRPWLAFAVAVGLAGSVLLVTHVLTSRLRRESLEVPGA